MFASADYQGWFLLGDQLSAGCACLGPQNRMFEFSVSFCPRFAKGFLQKVAQLRLFLIAVQNKSQNTTCKQPDLCNVT